MHDEEMASEASEFWERRRDLTPSTDVTDGGEGYRLVLLRDITCPAVLSASKRVLERLDQFECFNASPPAALHITVKLFDVSVDPSATGIENPGPAVRHVDEVVSSVVSASEPFEVEFTRFNLFPDVVYAEVADDGRLDALNRELCDHETIATLNRDEDRFIPHLTFGYFENHADYGALVDYLEANRTLQFPTLTVDEFALAAYDVGGRPPEYNRLETYHL